MIDPAGRHQLDGVEALLDARKYEAALERVRQVLSRDPSDAWAHALAGRALLGLGRYDEAVTAGRAAVSCEPSSPVWHRVLASLLGQHPGHPRNRTDAITEARRAVELGPSDPANHQILAQEAARTGSKNEADAAIRKTLELAPNSAAAWVTASFVAVRAKNGLAAEVAARKALSIQPGNSSAINNLGVAMRLQGRWATAAAAFYDAASLDPRSPTARRNVEGIGFQYLALASVVVLLPLLFIPPLFLAVRIGTSQWLVRTRPRFLQPLARRIGIRVASSKRARKRIEEHNRTVQRALSTTTGSGGWSSRAGRQLIGTWLVLLMAILAFIFFIFLMPLAIFGTGGMGAHLGLGMTAATFLGTGILFVRIVRRRRRVGPVLPKV